MKVWLALCSGGLETRTSESRRALYRSLVRFAFLARAAAAGCRTCWPVSPFALADVNVTGSGKTCQQAWLASVREAASCDLVSIVLPRLEVIIVAEPLLFCSHRSATAVTNSSSPTPSALLTGLDFPCSHKALVVKLQAARLQGGRDPSFLSLLLLSYRGIVSALSAYVCMSAVVPCSVSICSMRCWR